MSAEAADLPGEDDEGGAHLLLRAGDATIALPATVVLEIFEPERCHPVPGTPRYVIGIASLRGVPLPLVDLAAALDPEGEARAEGGARAQLGGRRVLVVSTASYLVGLVVDATLGVVPIGPAELRPVTVAAGDRWAAFALGELDLRGGGVAAVLDPEPFLDAIRVRS